MDWQPIETAPQDGTEILVHSFGRCFTACWNCWPEPAWRVNAHGFLVLEPTHWMALPSPPVSRETDREQHEP